MPLLEIDPAAGAVQYAALAAEIKPAGQLGV
jgi:hypothetical protein